MSIFRYGNYRSFLAECFAERSKGGRGEIARLAVKLRVSASLVGRIFKGNKDFTEEQAVEVASHLGLPRNEADYFLLLVQWERAGTQALKDAIQRRIDQDRVQAMSKGVVSIHANDLRPQDQSVFYSNWDFSAVRLMSELARFQDSEKLARRLGISHQRVVDVLQFLLQTGLCVREGELVKLGPAKTIVDKSSPQLQRHHLNWRIKALERVSLASESDFFYTAPMTIRKSDAVKLRKQIQALTEQAEKNMEESEPDVFCCLLIDWFAL